MKKYILKRFLQLIPVLVGITFLSFAMMRIAGSDAITELYGDKGAVAQEIIDAKRAELGLDQPFLTQYLAWVGGILTGDMGISYISGRDVFQTFVSKLPATLLLTAMLDIGTMMMELAALSFLGLGAKPPTAEWGSMMSDTRSLMTTSPWITFSPGIAIFISVMVFNLLGDTIRDYADPKSRGR